MIFFCYNYTKKIYKLIKIQDLIDSNFFLIKHIASQYLYLSKKYLNPNLLEIVRFNFIQ